MREGGGIVGLATTEIPVFRPPSRPKRAQIRFPPVTRRRHGRVGCPKGKSPGRFGHCAQNGRAVRANAPAKGAFALIGDLKARGPLVGTIEREVGAASSRGSPHGVDRGSVPILGAIFFLLGLGLYSCLSFL